MPGNGKVFISHAHDDNERCAPLLAALDAWGVDYWFDTQQLAAGADLSAAIQRAIAERDVFLRICTPAAQRSYWVRLETGAFRGLQARDHREGRDGRRVLINLILDAGYQPEPFDYAHIFIEAATAPRRAWLDELRRALSPRLPTSAPSVLGPVEPTPSGPTTHVVDARGAGEYPTVTSALIAARDGDRIEVLPGRYAESLVLDKSVTLVGRGERGAIVLEGREAPALRVEGGAPHVEHLTLRQLGGRNLDCVHVARGGLTLADCDVSAATTGACVNLAGPDEVTLRGNTIHDGGGWGVFAGGPGVVMLEDNRICDNAGSGLTVMRDAYVLARRNTIGRNAQHAVRIYAGGGGTFEDNDLRGNYLATWNIEPASYGKVLRERNRG